jgi:hypothetical protein
MNYESKIGEANYEFKVTAIAQVVNVEALIGRKLTGAFFRRVFYHRVETRGYCFYTTSWLGAQDQRI